MNNNYTILCDINEQYTKLFEIESNECRKKWALPRVICSPDVYPRFELLEFFE